MQNIQVKRVYDTPDPHDGFRVLVDRVWPRGLTKESVHADLWLKDAAPSTALRQWFSHDRAKWPAFRRRYFTELDARPEIVSSLRQASAHGRMTLLYSARDVDCNQAIALEEYLRTHSAKKPH
jgi:uncharacterized protein YeaO (DUF488 family)